MGAIFTAGVKCCSPSSAGKDKDMSDHNTMHTLAKKAYMSNIHTELEGPTSYDEFDSGTDSDESEQHLQVPAAISTLDRNSKQVNCISRDRSHSMVQLCNRRHPQSSQQSGSFNQTKTNSNKDMRQLRNGSKTRSSSRRQRRQRPRSHSEDNQSSSNMETNRNASMFRPQAYYDFNRPCLGHAYSVPPPSLDQLYACHSAASSPLSTLSNSQAHIILAYSDSSFPFNLPTSSNAPLKEKDEHEHGHDEYETETEDEDDSDYEQEHDGKGTRMKPLHEQIKKPFPMRMLINSQSVSNPLLLSM